MREPVRCYNCMYRHVSNTTGVPLHVEIDIEFNSLHDKKGLYKDGNYWVIKGRKYKNIKKKQIKGGSWVLLVDSNQLPITTKVDRIFYIGINPDIIGYIHANSKCVGKHKECEGGGWYIMHDKLLVEGKEFADITCYGHCEYDI